MLDTDITFTLGFVLGTTFMVIVLGAILFLTRNNMKGFLGFLSLVISLLIIVLLAVFGYYSNLRNDLSLAAGLYGEGKSIGPYLALFLLAYASPAYLFVVLGNYTVNAIIKKADLHSPMGRLKEAINNAHGFLLIVPKIFGGGILLFFSLLKDFGHSEKRKTDPKQNQVFPSWLKDKIWDAYGFLLFFSFDGGAIGMLSRLIVVFGLLCYIPATALFVLSFFVRK